MALFIMRMASSSHTIIASFQKNNPRKNFFVLFSSLQHFFLPSVLRVCVCVKETPLNFENVFFFILKSVGGGVC